MLFKERPPDNAEKTIRFGCGLFVGLGVGFYLTHEIWMFDPVRTAVIAGISSLLCGLGARKFGDRSWDIFTGFHR